MLWDMLVYTPWWVYVLFFYLLYIGYKASKPRTVSLKRLFIMPVVIMFIAFHNLFTNNTLIPSSVLPFSFAFLIGLLVGYFQVYRLKLKIDRKHHLIHTPGSWISLIIILIIFASRYYSGYEMNVNPVMLKQIWFKALMLSVSGFCSGLFLGRVSAYLYRYINDRQTELVQN